MKTRLSEPYRRTVPHNRHETPWLSAAVSIAFATAPLAVLLWVVPLTGIGIA